jgi:uroporphyrinogen-III decarboxylase
VLGFVGAPFTLATYIVEGGSSKNFAAIKRMAFGEPAVLHALLDKLADNVADYVRYQVRCGGCLCWHSVCVCVVGGGVSVSAAIVAYQGGRVGAGGKQCMAFGEPAVLHALLDKLADNVADYVRYQVRFWTVEGLG